MKKIDYEDTRLNQLQSFVDDMNSSNQMTHKLDTLNTWCSKDLEGKYIKEILFYTYNPFYQYYITPDTCKKLYSEDLNVESNRQYNTIFELLDDLRSRTITGHQAIQSVNNYAYQHESHKDLIFKVIGKDLELRVGDTLINKAIPKLIPTFDVALATDFEKVLPDVHDGTWYSSRKMDGVRCLAVISDTGKCTLWSRQGKQFDTLNKVVDEIESLGLKNWVLDGEICLVGADGADDFQGVMSQIRRKNHTIENPRFLLFDMLSLSEFNDKVGTDRLSNRLHTMRLAIPRDAKTLAVLEQTLITSAAELHSLLEDADHRGWEGLILRRDVGYEGKRGKNMLKCKTFHDAEYIVESIETGPFRVIENGLETTIETMTNVIIKHKGYPVSVGSGWSLEERKFFYANPNEIIGKTITVKYFQETKNKKGELSLRFPTKKYVYSSVRNT